jgi:Adaptin N terminal region
MSSFFAAPSLTNEITDVNSLRLKLQSLNPDHQRAGILKTLQLMTNLPTAASQLFPEILSCMHSTDLDVKRLSHTIFLYYANWSVSQGETKTMNSEGISIRELAVLGINSLKKDVLDMNPLIRGLAVRTLSSLRVKEAMEYVYEPLQKCARDADPYVRKTAALGIGKLYNFDRESVSEHGLLEILSDLLVDSNPLVISNACCVLKEMVNLGFLLDLNKSNFSSIVNLLTEGNEWSVLNVLDFLSCLLEKQVKLPDIDYMIQKSGILVSHHNPAVVMGSVKLLAQAIGLSKDIEIVREAVGRISPPLVSLLTEKETSRSITYLLLRGLSILCHHRSAIKISVTALLLNFDDSLLVKKEKISLLARMISTENQERVLAEFKNILRNEVDVEVLKFSVNKLAHLAYKTNIDQDKIVNILLEILMEIPSVKGDSIKALTAIIRGFPDKFNVVVPTIIQSYDNRKSSSIDVSDCIAFLIAEFNQVEHIQILLDLPITPIVLQAAARVILANNRMDAKSILEKGKQSYISDIRDQSVFLFNLINQKFGKQALLQPSRKILKLQSDQIQYPLSHICKLSSMYNEPVSFKAKEAEDEEDEGEELGLIIVGKKESGDEGKQDGNKESSATASAIDRSSASSSVIINKFLVLKPEVPGVPKGVTGLKIAAGIGRDETSQFVLAMTIGNFSTASFHGPFMLQFNKNSKGFVPVNKVIQGTPEELKPKEAINVIVPILEADSNRVDSSISSSTLQIAMKLKEDVFYFSVPINSVL